MSPESTFSITEAESTEEQARAVVSCIISASRCFYRSDMKNEQRMQVVKGLYGLVLYASEHWVEFMFSTSGQLDSTPREYLDGIEALIVELERRKWNAEAETQRSNSRPEIDGSRLDIFNGHPLLQHHLRRAMASRTQDPLERLGNVATGEGILPPCFKSSA